jgi:hypothetical protein
MQLDVRRLGCIDGVNCGMQVGQGDGQTPRSMHFRGAELAVPAVMEIDRIR